jgi:hypothetical protein
MLYARYSADGKHWTTWQHLEAADAAAANGPTKVFQGTLRVPYRERAPYDKLRLEYARREAPATRRWCRGRIEFENMKTRATKNTPLRFACLFFSN